MCIPITYPYALLAPFLLRIVQQVFHFRGLSKTHSFGEVWRDVRSGEGESTGMPVIHVVLKSTHELHIHFYTNHKVSTLSVKTWYWFRVIETSASWNLLIANSVCLLLLKDEKQVLMFWLRFSSGPRDDRSWKALPSPAKYWKGKTEFLFSLQINVDFFWGGGIP